MRYRLTARAERDVEDIDAYVSARNAPASVRLLQEFIRRWDLLTTQPRSGRPCDEMIVGLRSIVIGVYVTFYYIEAEYVVIVRVIHGRRDISADDFQP